MENGKHFCYNGKIITTGKLIISADNRSFRFGDGFFETMKMINGNIVLRDHHFQRLFSSLQLLKFENPGYFDVAYFSDLIKKISEKNNHTKLSRIRLTIFRGDGGLYEYENNFPNCIIQTWKINSENSILNNKGLLTGIYTKTRKSCDDFSHIKSNNFLPYIMAAMWAKENKLDDAIVLNNYNRIADATIANIFFVKDGKIKTPALSEGCVNGVMRKYLIECFKKENIPFEETSIETDEISEANEIFLTNSVRGISWVKQCGHYNYTNELSAYLTAQFTAPLFKI